MADSSGTTLMDLITSDGSSTKPPPASSATAPPPTDSAPSPNTFCAVFLSELHAGGLTLGDLLHALEDYFPVLLGLVKDVHPWILQALKALTYAPSSNSETLSRLYEIVFSILDKVLRNCVQHSG